jgi:hypothetical protein
MRTFERWEMSARRELADRGIGFHQATPLIDDARAYHAESGQDPWVALGGPAEFADDIAAALPAELAGVDLHGKTPRDYFSDAAFVLAWFGALGAVLGAIVVGALSIPVTVAGAIGGALCALAVLAGAVPSAARAAGHPRLAPWGLALSAGLVVAAGTAFTTLPRTRIGELPLLLLLLVSHTGAWLLTRPRRSPPPVPGDDAPTDPDTWFRRLEAVLVGRFDIPPSRATELVAETRAHVAESGSNPSEEFPSLAAYAHDLAQGEPTRQPPWWRTPAAAFLATVAVLLGWLSLVIDAALAGKWWMALLGAVAAPLAGRSLIARYRAWRP